MKRATLKYLFNKYMTPTGQTSTYIAFLNLSTSQFEYCKCFCKQSNIFDSNVGGFNVYF